MPPRKSNVSTTSNGVEEAAETTPARNTKEKDGLSIEDLTLPKSMVARLAKGVLPANTQIHKDALLALHKSATVFVNYIAANSSENAQSSGKKTIMPPDVIAALKDAEYDNFLPRLEAELKKYNEVQCDKRNTYRKKVKDDKAATVVKDGTQEATQDGPAADASINGTATNGHAEPEDADRPTKKLKGDAGQAVAANADAGSEPEDEEGDEDDADEDDEDNADEDGVDDESDGEEVQDETMEDPIEVADGSRVDIRDEALDGPDSDLSDG